MFETVLIANRGAIACRIAEVLRARGIRSIAVYSEADAGMPHVRAADEAVCIGPAPARESYLDGARIIAVAVERGADAIHPGYGFLAENAGFARACAAAGVVFVGPSPEAMEAMGDKAAARKAAVAAGVPVVPGSSGPLHDPAEAAEVAERVGYPVVVKAAAGGGGIGMVKVKKAEKLEKALARAGEVAARSFGDDTVYIERYLEGARHVEVQLLCDREGHCVHLFERECSVQRRHQKVIEEAPSPFVAERPALRQRLVEEALSLARGIGYEGAGTVEFLVTPTSRPEGGDRAASTEPTSRPEGGDGAASTPIAEGEHFFIEMNTRLQVEHAVTVAVTGVDIIGWQLDIAAGAPLTLDQGSVEVTGAAVECRVYAEDPLRRFLPQPGHITGFEAPEGPGIHVMSAVEAGSEVTPYYDPMLAKLIVHGASRDEALARTRAALEGFSVTGIKTNLALLRDVAAHPVMAAGQCDTVWLEAYAKERARARAEAEG